MKLVSFSVQNYRSLVKTKKLPIGDMTVLLGPNNEGKSNILRAMVCAIRIVDTLDVAMIKRDGRIYFPNIGEQNFYRWEEDFPISLQAANPDGNSIFTLEFSLMPEEVAEFKKEVKSNLNGTLPIEIHIGKTDPAFRVVKKGPGGKALSDKRVPIAKFIGKRFALEYFPTVRSANTAGKIIERMIARDLQQAASR